MRPPKSGAQLIGLVAKREIVTKLRDRSYLLSMLAFIGILAIVIVFNVLMNRGASAYKVAVVGQPDQAFTTAAQSYADQFGASVEFTSVPDRAAGEQLLGDDEADVLLDGTTLRYTSSLSGELGGILQGAHATASIQQQAQQQGIDPATLEQVMTVQPLATEASEADGGFERGIIAIVAIGFAYMMMILIVQFVAQGVVEEKSSRVVELLMTAVKPRQLLAGKVLGLGLLGFGQLLLTMILGVTAAIAGNLIAIPASGVSTILQVLAWFVLGYAFFATLAAALASLVSRQEDLGSAMMPITMIPMLAFFAAFQVLNKPDSTVSVILSMVPGFSPTTMPVRSALTSVPIWQYVLAVVLQLIAIYLLIRVAARIYTGALLKTSGKLKAREALARSRDGDVA